MLYSQLGRTGLVVSRLAYGAMTFTMGNKSRPTLYKTDEEAARAVIGKALDAGINFFDTADVYTFGESEILLGKVLAPHRQDVIISTKAGLRMGEVVTRRGLNRHHLLNSIDGSLKRLGTDYVDVYIVHRDDPFTPLEETLQALDDIVRQGKARYLGFSNWPAWKVAAAMELQKANGWAPFTHGQLSYSLVERDIEIELLPMMKHYGLGLTAWSPLSMGFLSGKVTRENLRDPNSRFGARYFAFFDAEAKLELVDRMREIAGRHGATVPQVALAWLLSKEALTSILIGAGNVDQLTDNIGSVDLALTGEELTLLDAGSPPPSIYPMNFLDAIVDPVKAALARKPGDPA
jgi:aryl-alcohol dehydrogenase-like predicted oxidoreductase